jgi:hypothetical protein
LKMKCIFQRVHVYYISKKADTTVLPGSTSVAQMKQFPELYLYKNKKNSFIICDVNNTRVPAWYR